MEPFFSFVQKFGVVPPSDAQVLRSYAKFESQKAGSFFLLPGQVCHRVGFLLQGVVRVFVREEDGREITRGFPSEGHFMVDLKSFNSLEPTLEYWEAMTEIEFVYWETEDINVMKPLVSCWKDILIPMTQHILLSESHERTEMFNDDATTRYAKFLKRYPHIVSRVPLRYIANYLGIAPQSLSRIRQYLAKSAKK